MKLKKLTKYPEAWVGKMYLPACGQGSRQPGCTCLCPTSLLTLRLLCSLLSFLPPAAPPLPPAPHTLSSWWHPQGPRHAFPLPMRPEVSVTGSMFSSSLDPQSEVLSRRLLNRRWKMSGMGWRTISWVAFGPWLPLCPPPPTAVKQCQRPGLNCSSRRRTNRDGSARGVYAARNDGVDHGGQTWGSGALTIVLSPLPLTNQVLSLWKRN